MNNINTTKMTELVEKLSLIIHADNNADEKDIHLLDIIDEYKRKRPFRTRGTEKIYVFQTKKFIKHLMSQGITSCEEITYELVHEYFNNAITKRKSGRFETHILNIVFNTVSIRVGLIMKRCRNELKCMHQRHYDKKKNLSHRPLTDSEIRRLFSVIDKRMESFNCDSDKRHLLPLEILSEFKDALLFARCYGMRLSSVCNMETSDFKRWRRSGRFIHVPFKTRFIKTIPIELPIVDCIGEVLERRQVGSTVKRSIEHVFPLLHERYAKEPTSVMNMFKMFKRNSGLKDNENGIVSFHSFRTTFVTRMDECGCPYSVTDSITGHAPSVNGMHSRYSKISVYAKRKWIRKALKVK